MTPKRLSFRPFSSYGYIAFFIFFLCTIEMNAQCAGIAGSDNNTLNVCDIANPSSKTIDLNALLGVHTAGGIWSDDNKSGGLNLTTGILNAQQIDRSGIYNYTYTVSDGLGCTDTAVITVTIGGYTGVPGPNTSICSDEIAYNLFQVIDGNYLTPQIGGTWHDDDNSGALSNNFLNATLPTPNKIYPYTYAFTYTIPTIGTCAAPPPSKISVTIQRAPEPGTPTNLLLCSNQLASYTNFDLNNQLSGEDAGGIWTEFGTSEISNAIDSTIDIQNIYNTKGPNTYSFKYTVLPDNRVCTSKSKTIEIRIEKLLDFTGATLSVNSDICENEIPTANYTGILKQGAQVIQNGNYVVSYTISGMSNTLTTTQSFINGVLEFPIPSAYFQQLQDYTITIRNINLASNRGACNNIIGTITDVLHISPMPKIDSATLTIPPVCKTYDAQVSFSGISNLTDGNYDIIYSLSGKNIINGINGILSITGGIGTFPIPAALISNIGTSTITITKITNSATGCTNSSTLNKGFTVNPLPDVSNLAVAIKDICQGQPITVKLTGLGTLTDISIDYTISGANTVISQTIALDVIGGTRSFDIPAIDIPNVGLSTFTITNVTNVLTGCSSPINKSANFTVNSIPSLPIADDIQVFCTSENATVANLIPQGTQYQWFDSDISAVPLASTTPLITRNYFVKEVNMLTKCESPLKPIVVQINKTPQINNATITINPICQGFFATVNFSGTFNLADGDYDIFYNLTDNNTANSVPMTLSVMGGLLSSFDIPANLIPKAGTTTITITNITNTLTHCTSAVTLSKVFNVNAVPDVTNMVVTVLDGCLEQPINVDITGLGALTSVSLTYSVNGANNINAQTVSLAVSGGKASFLIPATAFLFTGNNTLVITNLTNSENTCSSVVNTVFQNFNIQYIPSIPIASDKEFCEIDLATVANLTPNGSQYKWYDSATSTTPLSSSTLLVTENYYLKEANTTGCESEAAIIGVTINSVATPTLNPNGQEFCGADKPTIQSLSNNTDSSVNLTWYDAAINGTAFANTNLLKEGTTYYGFNHDANAGCTSNPLPVTVSLTDCSVTPDKVFIPDGFSPNGDGNNDTFQIVDIEFLYPNYTLEIFNRYGNIIFKGNINKPAWDGKISNSTFVNGDAPTGVYFYIIHYNKDNLSPQQGQLYLNR